MSADRAPSPAETDYFLAEILPRARRVAWKTFAYFRCDARREDAVQDVLLDCWACFRRLCEGGRGTRVPPGQVVRFSVLRVKCARRTLGSFPRGGHCPDRDALSPRSQLAHGHRTEHLGAWDASLKDDTRTPVVDQVVFRMDFRAWRGRQAPRDVALIDDLATGEIPYHVARRRQVCPATISKLRVAWRQSWRTFQSR